MSVKTAGIFSSSRGKVLAGLAFVLAAGGLLAYFNSPARTPLGWSEDFQAAQALAHREKRPMLVEFGAAWCPPCQYMARKVLPDPRVREALREFVTVKVDVDSNAELAATFRADSLPTFVFLDAAGREVHRVVGGLDVREFLAEIARARGQ